MAHLLIVEDDPDWCRLLKFRFAKSGFECECVYSVSEAKKLLTENYFDLIILDLRLDENDPEDNGGEQIIQWMVENRIDSKIIIFSGYVRHVNSPMIQNVSAILEKGAPLSELLNLSNKIVST